MSEPDRPERPGSRRWWLYTVLPAVLIALATAGSAPWWLTALSPSRGTPATGAVPSPQVAAVTAGAGPVTAAVPASAATGAPGPGSVAVSPAEVGSPVRNTTPAGRPIILEMGRGLDLDSAAGTWGMEDWTTAQLYLDVVYDGVVLSFRGRATPFAAPPTPSDCAAATSFVEDVMLLGNPRTMYFCEHTSEGRFSAVTVHVLNDPNLVALEITTWQAKV